MHIATSRRLAVAEVTGINGKKIPRKKIEQKYYDLFKKNLMFSGVDYSKASFFAGKFFETSNFIGVTKAIDSGFLIMTNLDAGNGDYHNVVIVGYHPNGDYIYMDPIYGSLRETSS